MWSGTQITIIHVEEDNTNTKRVTIDKVDVNLIRHYADLGSLY